MTEEPDGLLRSIRVRRERQRRRLAEGEPSLGRHLAQVGVLGWTIVVPGLIGMFLGRWLDRRFDSGIFWTGPLLLVGLALGCWSAWKWMHGK
jgi:ATP synthase protein I